MLLTLAILALAASTRVELVDEVYPIPADEWRYVPLELKQRPAQVEATYEVTGGAGQVRVALMRGADLDRLRQGLPHGVMALTEPGRTGALQCRVRPPGEYMLVVDNEMGRGKPASVHLRIWLDFSAGGAPGAAQLPSGRRRLVVVLSLAGFLAIVTWSGRKLLRGVRQ